MNQPILDPKRLEGESFEDYKKRQKAISYWMTHRNDENFIHVSKYVTVNRDTGNETIHVPGTQYIRPTA